MAAEYSFDIVSKLDRPEVQNAVNQAKKEASTRYDFRGTNPVVELKDNHIFIQAENEMTLRSLRAVVEEKLVKRGVSIKFLEYGKEEPGARESFKQELKFKEGIEKEEGKRFQELIKKAGLKVKSQIQDQQLRVSGKDKDELQKVIKLAKDNEGETPLQFVNYR